MQSSGSIAHAHTENRKAVRALALPSTHKPEEVRCRCAAGGAVAPTALLPENRKAVLIPTRQSLINFV